MLNRVVKNITGQPRSLAEQSSSCSSSISQPLDATCLCSQHLPLSPLPIFPKSNIFHGSPHRLTTAPTLCKANATDFLITPPSPPSSPPSTDLTIGPCNIQAPTPPTPRLRPVCVCVCPPKCLFPLSGQVMVLF